MILAAFKEVLASFRRALAAGAGYWIASTLCVQGSAYLAQILLGRMLAPQDFGVVRAVESYLSILLMVATLGIPSAVYRLAAVTPESERKRLAGHVVALTTIGSCAVAGFVILACQLFPVVIPGESGKYVSWLAPCLISGAIARTVLGYHQGCLNLKKVSYLPVIPTVVMIVAIVILVRRFSLNGWVYARLSVESLGLILALVSVGRIPLLSWEKSQIRSVLSLAAPSLIALSLDKALASGDLLILDRISLDRSLVGTYGAATVIVALFLLPAGALNVVGFNRIAQSSTRRSEAFRHLRTLLFGTILTTLPFAVAFPFAGAWVMRVLFGFEYHLPAVVLAVISVSMFLRSLILCFGSYALAVGRPSISIYSNLVGLIAVIVFSLWLIPNHGALGAAAASVGGAILRLCYFMVATCMISKESLGVEVPRE